MHGNVRVIDLRNSGNLRHSNAFMMRIMTTRSPATNYDVMLAQEMLKAIGLIN